ncbi:MAG TPA: hypothetical protein VKB79_11400 [Bryobacteraceae bacterium]|nr:hypothetical protein [Bryobacteraceae bacterium]
MNDPSTRRKRAPLKQDAPIRNRLTTPYEASRPHAGEAHPPPSGFQESAGNALRDALECGVRTAYTVINEYMRRGYEAARASQINQHDRGDMRDDTRGYTGWNNAWNPMANPMQQWASMMRAWAEAWSAFAPGGWPQQMWNAAWPAYGMPGPPSVSVQVCSHRRAEITTRANLMPGAECSSLTVCALAAEGSKAQLKGVSISGAPGAVRIVVPVPAEQPSGAYCGEIRTADGRGVGNLTVTIADLPRDAA